MHANDRAIELGCTQIRQVVNMTGVSLQTLNNWFNNPKKRALFDLVCCGVAHVTAELREHDKFIDNAKRRQSLAYLAERVLQPEEIAQLEQMLSEDENDE